MAYAGKTYEREGVAPSKPSRKLHSDMDSGRGIATSPSKQELFTMCPEIFTGSGAPDTSKSSSQYKPLAQACTAEDADAVKKRGVAAELAAHHLKTHGAARDRRAFSRKPTCSTELSSFMLGRNTALLLTRYETVNDYGDVPGKDRF